MNKQKPLQNEQQDALVTSSIAPGEIIIGELVGLTTEQQPLVTFAEQIGSEPITALTTVKLDAKQLGRQVALLFANGNPQQPVIMGLLHNPLHEAIAQTDQVNHTQETEQATAVPVQLDNETLHLTAKKEIILECGKASITLTAAGKVLIRGEYVLSRSRGANRIAGASIQLN